MSFCWGHTQQVKNNNFLDFTFGASFPVGKYAKRDITNDASGFAKTGELLTFSYLHLINKNFGLSAAIRGQRNPLNTKAFETSLSQANFYETPFPGSTPNPNPTQYPSQKYGNWNLDNNSWLLGSLLIGGHGQVSPQPSNKCLLTMRAMFGLAYAKAPEINGKSNSDTAMAQIKQSSSAAFGVAYSISGGLKFGLSNKIYLLAQAEYFGTSKISFKEIETTFTSVHYSNGAPTSASTHTATLTGRQKIASVNISFGVAVSL